MTTGQTTILIFAVVLSGNHFRQHKENSGKSAVLPSGPVSTTIFYSSLSGDGPKDFFTHRAVSVTHLHTGKTAELIC